MFGIKTVVTASSLIGQVTFWSLCKGFTPFHWTVFLTPVWIIGKDAICIRRHEIPLPIMQCCQQCNSLLCKPMFFVVTRAMVLLLPVPRRFRNMKQEKSHDLKLSRGCGVNVVLLFFVFWSSFVFESRKLPVSRMPEKIWFTACCVLSQPQMDQVKQHSKAKWLPTRTQTHTHTLATMKEGISTASTPTQEPLWSALRHSVTVPQGQTGKHTDTLLQSGQTHSLYTGLHIYEMCAPLRSHTKTCRHAFSSWGRRDQRAADAGRVRRDMRSARTVSTFNIRFRSDKEKQDNVLKSIWTSSHITLLVLDVFGKHQ